VGRARGRGSQRARSQPDEAGNAAQVLSSQRLITTCYHATVTLQKAHVAARIKSARADKGWKQKHLAAQVKVEPITVSRWERGATTPDFNALTLIAEATGKPLTYFLGEEESAGEPPLVDAVKRLEAAAERIATEGNPIADAVAELRAELARLR
jgi:transcriptional regulator with XRE-family HTH domain